MTFFLQLLDSGDSALNTKTQEVAMTLCMHAAAMKPSYTFKEELPEDAIAQAVEEGKT